MYTMTRYDLETLKYTIYLKHNNKLQKKYNELISKLKKETKYEIPKRKIKQIVKIKYINLQNRPLTRNWSHLAHSSTQLKHASSSDILEYEQLYS